MKDVSEEMDVKNTIQEVIKEVTMKQLNLSMTKSIFEGKQKECKDFVRKIFQDVAKWASKAEVSLLEQVEELSEKRRREMEEINAALVCLQPRLARQYEALSTSKPDLVAKNVYDIKSDAEEIYPDDASEDLTVVELHLSRLAQGMFLYGSTEELFRIISCLRPEQLRIENHPRVTDVDNGEIVIRIVTTNAEYRIPKFLLPEMTVTVVGADQCVKTCTSLKTLLIQKRVHFVDSNRGLEIKLSVKDIQPNSVVNVLLSRCCIRNSPTLLTFPKLWNTVGSNNVTRSGKRVDDLDESDLISMGYKLSEKTVLLNKRGSVLENGITPKITSESESSMIRLNPTPNVTAAKDTVVDPNAETLVMLDDNDEPLSSTIRHSDQSPPPVPSSKLLRGISEHVNSPYVDRNALNLPLDQPSPLTVNSSKKNDCVGSTSVSGEGSLTLRSHDATPCTSTQNLSDKLRSITFPKLDDDDLEVGGDGDQDQEKQGMENVLRLQKVLTGEISAGQAIEESKHDKSVSFHPNTTIKEPAPNRSRRVSVTSVVNVMDLVPEGKEKPDFNDTSIGLDSSERSSMEEMWTIRTGLTKTTDGELALSKSISKAQNNTTNDESVWEWEQTLGTYTKNLAAAESNAKAYKPSSTLNESMWDQSLNASDVLVASSEKKKMKKELEFNFSKSEFNLNLTKHWDLEEMPQAITKDSNNLLYLSHPEANRITVFSGWKNKGYFETKIPLKLPRYILAVPNNRIVVLDRRGFHLFTLTGIHIKSLLSEEAATCRGLEYYKRYGYILSIQKGDDGSSLLVIDFEVHDIVVKKILIKASCTTSLHVEKTKCIFLVCSKNRVFISDFGLHAVYIVYLDNEQNEVFSSSLGKDRLQEPRGLAVDPAGNLLVATDHLGKVYVFNSHGNYVRTLNVPQVKKIADLYLDEELKSLFITDTDSKALFQFSITSQT